MESIRDIDIKKDILELLAKNLIQKIYKIE